ncbi:hypothetical protein GCM10022406_26760 [Hymenobacter algoricola]|uniref:histidine kinase n=1 Tax=Hymenobacter algoricola TaxID=486267 RepID=A0ABP7NB17_9BACT
MALVLALALVGAGSAAQAVPAALPAGSVAAPDSLQRLSTREQQLRDRFRQNQRRGIDSIRALLRAHPQPDSTRVILLTWLSDAVGTYDVRASGPICREALALARRVRHRDLVAETLLDLADYHISLAEYPAAIARLQQSRAEFRRLRDVGGVMRCLNRLAIIADQRGRYAQALGYCYQAMALGSTGNERRFHTTLRIQAASIYTRMGEFGKARELLRAALAVAREFDYPDRLNLILNELGELSRRQRQWAAARRYFEGSLVISRRLNDLPDILATELNLAEVNEQQGNYEAALRLGYGVLHQAQTASLLPLIPRAQVVLARASLGRGRPDSAIWYGQRGWQASRLMRFQEGLRDASQVLAAAYARRGNFHLAYQAQQRVTAYNDSLTGAEVTRRTAALQFNQELRQQQAQIRLLTQQQELDRLREQRRLAISAAVALLTLLGGGVGLWRYRQRQRRRETDLRTRLAADLHDDVGTLLSQISLQSGLLQEGLADPAAQREQLSQISEASRSAVRQLNDVVWSLDAHNDHLPDLLDRMRDYAHEVLGPAGLELVFDVSVRMPSLRLPVLLRRNLYLIYKEALHNILKHARQATRVTVGLHLTESSQLVLSIADDGPPPLVPPALDAGPHQRRTGHGLRNIGQRAAAVGGEATAGSGPAGFRLRVLVPLPAGARSGE